MIALCLLAIWWFFYSGIAFCLLPCLGASVCVAASFKYWYDRSWMLQRERNHGLQADLAPCNFTRAEHAKLEPRPVWNIVCCCCKIEAKKQRNLSYFQELIHFIGLSLHARLHTHPVSRHKSLFRPRAFINRRMDCFRWRWLLEMTIRSFWKLLCTLVASAASQTFKLPAMWAEVTSSSWLHADALSVHYRGRWNTVFIALLCHAICCIHFYHSRQYCWCLVYRKNNYIKK